jgi:subtilase family serine protease
VKKTTSFLLVGFVCLVLAGSVIAAESAVVAGSAAAPRIVQSINENDLVQLKGNTHPLARTEFDQGAVPDSLPMEHLLVQLQRTAQREQALDRLIAEQQNPNSANYHKWLTAEQIGRNFGPSQQDVKTVVSWLESHGWHVNAVYPSAMVIDISGTAGQVRDTFHTEIHTYNVAGEKHIANTIDPQIPAALASVVEGVASLHNFMPKPMARRPTPLFSFPCTGCPGGFDGAQIYLEGPADFATIYNENPLFKAGITGKGQTIAVLEDTDIKGADVVTFRKAFGLSSYSGTFTQIHPAPPSGANDCPAPVTNGDEFEASLDAEWAGATAPDADVELASCADTATAFGGDLALSNLVNSKKPPHIISYSYGECETDLGASANKFYAVTYQQAAAEGISVFVAAGDWAAAVCDASFASGVYAVSGISVNGLASTPYNTAVGGTDYSDFVDGTLNTYWNLKNGPARESAKSYIPEMTWNESCAGSVLYQFYGYTNGLSFCNSSTGGNFIDIVAGSGGPSFLYAKPAWQAVFGNPSDHRRDIPDVSLFASNGFWNQAIALCWSDASQGGTPCDYTNPTDAFFNSGGGTSFASPQFAGIQALINQKRGGPQGNAAPNLYRLAAKEYGGPGNPNKTELAACNSSKGNKIGGACTFRDVTRGNIDVPCFGTNNCYEPVAADFGVLSTSDSSLQIAYPTTAGWDFSTGLGSVNVTDLVNSWP